MRTTSIRTALLLSLIYPSPSALADEPRPAITVRLDHPDRQVQAVIDLFRGSRAAHPAAALTGWKRASREPRRLGKPLEALIAAFNPAMAEEIRTLDGAELALWFDAEGGQPAWGASLPADDGSIAALATALVLSGGAAENPLEGLAVDRLGPPGSALMAKGPGALLVAGSSEGLKEARIRSDRPRVRHSGDGIRFGVDPGALDGSKSLALRRMMAVLGEDRKAISGGVGLVGSTLTASVDVKIAQPAKPSSIDPRWLDWLPTDRVMAAFSVAIDPTPASWDSAFRLADRVEKVDPDRSLMAPIRLRLDLLARTLGFRLDGDLLSHLRGVTGWAGGDGRTVDQAFIRLQLDDEAVAGRMFERVKPLPNSVPPARPEPGSGRWLGKVEGRVLRLFRFGPSVVATWGDGVIEASLVARDKPERSAARVFRDRRRDPEPACLAAIWPSRFAGLIPIDPSIAEGLAEAEPILWSAGWNDPAVFRLDGSWARLDVVVKRFLDRIPFDPPTDH